MTNIIEHAASSCRRKATPKLRLRGKEGDTVLVDLDLIRLMRTIRKTLVQLGINNNNIEEEVIHLPTIPVKTLQLIAVWCRQHIGDPEPPAEEERSQDYKPDTTIPDWDAEFLKVDQGTLFELILAANHLDVKGLLDVSCKTVANMIKGKSVEEIRTTFNIVNDFTPEEEEQIRRENAWVEDTIED